MFRTKICGITSVQDALAAVEAGVEAIGLNFYPASPRCISIAKAAQISKALPSFVTRVGLFVNSPIDQIQELVGELSLDLVQLHGDEPASLVGDLHPLRVIRAVRSRDRMFSDAISFLESCDRVGQRPEGLLVDAYEPGTYGGTGKTVDWTCVPALVHRLESMPVVLAGGLTPGNVAQAVRVAAPFGVDTASGVEVSPGRKSPELMSRFVAAAKAAFAEGTG